MKVIYNNGKCFIDSVNVQIKTIVIYYEGNAVFNHSFKTLESFNFRKNTVRIKNYKNDGLFINGNNQIHIGFTEFLKNNFLFNYNGYFKITKVLVNNLEINFENNFIDIYEENNIKWDDDDTNTWDKSDKTYKFGVMPKVKRVKNGFQ